MSYFPMFVELKDQDCLVVGGGRIALRKVQVLQDFGAAVTVVAKKIVPELEKQAGVCFLKKECEPEDLAGRKLVIAATADREQNRKISEWCKNGNIPVNVVDQPEDCSFIFPAYLKQRDVVAAFSSGGQSPVMTQHLKEQMRPVMTEEIGKLAACLGHIREYVKQCVGTEELRKKVYQELLQAGLEGNGILSEEKIREVIGKASSETGFKLPSPGWQDVGK